MKNNTKQKLENLFFQLWYVPIVEKRLLASLSPTNLHTLLGLACFMDKNGFCYPSLKALCYKLGIRSQATLSRRISRLEQFRFEGKPIITVLRSKPSKNGEKFQFSNNRYFIETDIISIFNLTPSTSKRRKQQMEDFKKARQKLTQLLSTSSNAKRTNKL